jgi:hypothetical protein
MGAIHEYRKSIKVNKWEKFNVSTSTATRYREVSKSSAYSTTTTGSVTYYDDYYVDPILGLKSDAKHNAHAGWILGTASSTMYYFYKYNGTNIICTINMVSGSSNNYTIWLTAISYVESYSITIYSKGTTPYGNIITKVNKLPEEGTLIEGSEEDGYYVIEIDGISYYYELIK